MIEKKIYYFWYGSSEPKYVQNDIDSWKRCNPDFEVIKIPEEYIDMNLEWNKKAFKRKNWSYLSDPARFNFMRSHSGIYLDTDTFMINPFTQDMLESSIFLYCESAKCICPGAIGSDGSDFSKQFLNDWYAVYENWNEGSLVSSPTMFMPIGEKYNLKPVKHDFAEYPNNVKIYAKEYFRPFSYSSRAINGASINEKTIAVDLGMASAIPTSGWAKNLKTKFDTLEQEIKEGIKKYGTADSWKYYSREVTIDPFIKGN
jgi:hypothetical protein